MESDMSHAFANIAFTAAVREAQEIVGEGRPLREMTIQVEGFRLVLPATHPGALRGR